MGGPCRSSRCGGSALAGARVFGGRRSWHGIARRRAGRRLLLERCGGVACIRVCTLGRRLPSSVVGRPRGGAHRRTCVRMLVARWRSCVRSVSVLSCCAARRRACCVVGCRYTRAAVWSLGGLYLGHQGTKKTQQNTHPIPLGHHPVSFELRGPGFWLGYTFFRAGGQSTVHKRNATAVPTQRIGTAMPPTSSGFENMPTRVSLTMAIWELKRSARNVPHPRLYAAKSTRRIVVR